MTCQLAFSCEVSGRHQKKCGKIREFCGICFARFWLEASVEKKPNNFVAHFPQFPQFSRLFPAVSPLFPALFPHCSRIFPPRASGRTLYNTGRDSWGYWQVRGDQYCSMWPPSDLWACYDMARRGDVLRFFGAAGDSTDGTLRAESE